MISGWGPDTLGELSGEDVVALVAGKPLDLAMIRDLVASAAARAAGRRQAAAAES